jgi:hypothetical protein
MSVKILDLDIKSIDENQDLMLIVKVRQGIPKSQAEKYSSEPPSLPHKISNLEPNSQDMTSFYYPSYKSHPYQVEVKI